MFHEILVPVDLTDQHVPALRIAAELAKASGGEVVLLHVIELIHGISREEEQDFYDRLERSAQSHLARLGGFFKDYSVPCRAEVLYGSRAEEIVRYSLQFGAYLIVLTSHRVDLQRPAAGWGTLSYKVGILSQCPVLLVK